jgi:hypothetical protein
VKYALVIAEIDSGSRGGILALQSFASSVEALGIQDPLAKRLNAGTYLVPLEHGLHALSLLVLQAEERQLQVHTLFFECDPAWVTSDFRSS